MNAGKDVSRAAATAASLSGTGPLGIEDVDQPAALVARLRDPQNPIGAYLCRQFTDGGRALLNGHDGGEPTPELQQAMVDELNRLLGGDGDLWDDEAFRTVPMREEVRKRLRRPAAPRDRAWTNRFRLEVALPELAPRRVNQLEQAGVELFKAGARARYEAAVERQMHRLETLGVIDDETRDRLWMPVLVGAHLIAILEVQKAAISRRLNHAALIAATLVLVVMPALAWKLGGRPAVSIGNAVALLRYVYTAVAALIVIGALVACAGWLSTRFLLRRVHDPAFHVIAFVSWPGLVMAYSAFEIRTLLNTGTLDDVVTAAGLLAADGLWLVLLVWLGLRQASQWSLERWFEDDHADVVVTDGLLSCLVLLDGQSPRLWSLPVRQQIAAQLERVAACIERVFPRRFEGRASADPWVAQTAREMALGLRKLKRWVATPLEDTIGRLVGRLREDLLHAAAGAWGHLERSPDEAVVPATARPVREMLAHAIRTIVIAALPLAGVWAARAYGLGEPLRTQLAVSASAWAVLTLLLYLDPNSAKQLATLRDALPGGKGKD